MAYLATAAITTFAQVELGYNAIQAYCTQKSNISPHFYTRFDKAKWVFYLADTIAAIAAWVLLLADTPLDSLFYDVPEYGAELFGYVSILAPVLLGIGIVYLINKLYKQTLTLPPADPTQAAAADTATPAESFTFSRPGSEKIKQVFYTTRLVLNIGLLFFSPLNPFLLLNVGLQVYSLAKLTQRKWVVFTREVSYSLTNGLTLLANKVSFTYSFLMFEIKKAISKPANTPADTSDEVKDPCPVCLDEQEGKTVVPFCDKHTMHPECIVELLRTKATEFGRGFRVTSRIRHETHRYTNGIYTGSSFQARYTCNLSDVNIPTCPSCRSKSSRGEVSVHIHDLQLPSSTTTINWLPAV